MMNTRLTLADVRASLEGVVTSTTLKPLVNQVCERYTLSGKWKGCVIRLIIAVQPGTNYITLGPEYLSAIGVAYNHWPTPIFGEFHTYFESGPGTPIETLSWLGQLQDIGDGWCSQSSIIEGNSEVSPTIPAQPGSIVLFSTGSDNGKTLRLFGIQQESGLPVVDSNGELGEQITLNAPSVTSTNHFSRLTDVIKAPTNGIVTAWVAPTGGGSQYQIATWRPGETRPRYRRYVIGRATKQCEILAQRRFLPIVSETDWVIPGNLAALKFGLRALRYEDTGYDDKASECWGRGLKYLDDEATASRGGAAPSIDANTWGAWVSPIPHQH